MSVPKGVLVDGHTKFQACVVLTPLSTQQGMSTSIHYIVQREYIYLVRREKCTSNEYIVELVIAVKALLPHTRGTYFYSCDYVPTRGWVNG